MPIIQPIPCLKDNYAYLIHAPGQTDAVVVDPSEAAPVAVALKESGLSLVGILATHHHQDHVGGVAALVAAACGPGWVAAHALERGRVPEQTVFVEAPEHQLTPTTLVVAGVPLLAMHIPGHTRGAIAWALTGPGGVPTDIFTGDTLFGAGCGRLFEGARAQRRGATAPRPPPWVWSAKPTRSCAPAPSTSWQLAARPRTSSDGGWAPRAAAPRGACSSTRQRLCGPTHEFVNRFGGSCHCVGPSPTGRALCPSQRCAVEPRETDSLSPPMKLTHLHRLEAESIHIMREVIAETEHPVMLYSIGKDSSVMLHLAKKAFYPAPPPFPLLHVDTTWKFSDMYAMRDRVANESGMDLIVHVNPEAKAQNVNPFTHGSAVHTDMWKTQGLKQALDKYKFDAAFGGGRRDEEKSRAKERVLSFRSAAHRWDPMNQRPELWRLYNARKHKGESIRVFPLSNWTEQDVWQYIYLENIPIVPLYYSKLRPVVERDGTLIMVDDVRMPQRPGEQTK